MLIRSSKNIKIPPKFIILITVFLDVFGFSLIIPILPYYVESFNVSSFVVTLLFAVFSLFSFFSTPILGIISDKKGRRPVLLVSLFSSAIGWIIFTFSQSILGLFIGRIIDGAAAGNISTAQNYMVDISKDPKDRTKNLGLVGMIFGISFIIGPLIGGVLSGINIKIPFFIVTFLTIINTILAYFFLPETNHDLSDKKLSINPFNPIIKAIKDKKLFPLYLGWLLFGIAISINQSIITLYVSDIFGWKSTSSGLMMALVGIVILINQSFFLKKVWLKYFKESYLIVQMLLVFSIGYFIMAIPWKLTFLIFLIITTFCNSTLRAIINSQIIGLTNKKDQGETMGILSSIFALSMIIGPLLGGASYEIREYIPFLISGLILFITFIFLSKIHKNIKRTKHIETDPVDVL